VSSTFPMPAAARPPVPDPAAHAAPARYAFDETCSVLLGWQRRDGVLRLLTPTVAVVGGIAGLRPGDTLRLVLYRGEVVVRDCRVTRATLQGIELETLDTAQAPTAGMTMIQ
jgi:hypothetical protein